MLTSINQTQPKDTLMKGIKLNIVFKKIYYILLYLVHQLTHF